MSFQRHVTFWLGLALVLGCALYLLSDALVPFAAAFVLAYILTPFVNRLEGLGLGRVLASILVMGFLVLVIVALLLIGVPLLADQVASFAVKVPGYAERVRDLVTGSELVQRYADRATMDQVSGSLGGAIGSASEWLGSISKSVLSGGRAIFSVISLIFIAPIIAFYLMIDWKRMNAAIESWVPVENRETVMILRNQIDKALTGFLRGQSVVCLFLGTWYSVGLALVGVNFGVLIGVTAGLFSFIPFVGTGGGLIISLIVATAQFWPDYWHVLGVLAVFGTGQFLEGNVLSPKIVGEAVGLHPVWLMFSLFAFGSLFGFLGLLVAVPMAATLGVLIRFALRHYRESPFYLGTGGVTGIGFTAPRRGADR
jgi:predicted PurR-regulated permease PerM